MLASLVSCGARRPTFQYSQALGCGDIFAYVGTADRREFLVVSADKGMLGLSTDEKEVNLSRASDALRVWIDIYSQAPSEPYCTDIAPPPGSEFIVSSWLAVSGRVRIQLSPHETDATGTAKAPYRARIRLEECEFSGPSGALLKQPEPLEFEATVGLYAG